MPPRKQWVFSPGSGGVPIKEAVRRRTEQRIRRYAEPHFAGRHTRLDVRFRGHFCYIDAYTEPEPLGPNWPRPGSPETREQMMERLRNTPTHLCRLRYFGREDHWGFAFYKYATSATSYRYTPPASSSARRRKRSIRQPMSTSDEL